MHKVNVVWTNFCRFVLAIVFIFSGFVKANDIYGTAYKIEDYFRAFGWIDFFPDFVPFFTAALLAVFEFTLGAYLLFGIRKKLTSIAVTLTMLVMTPFTLFLAITNPVDDCGCFGEVLILTNWETFWKNVVLLFFACWLHHNNRLIAKFISRRSQWIISLYAIVYAIGIIYHCVAHLPIFDFQPYYVGANILEQMTIPENEKAPVYDTYFILEKDGIKKEFTLEEYPDSTWIFVDSRPYIKEEGYVPPITGFILRVLETGEDVTTQILQDSTYTFLLIAPHLEIADDSSMDLINDLYDYSVENHYPFYCVTSSMDEECAHWEDKTGGEYPFLSADPLILRAMIRSNPGLILLKGGTIIGKWSNRDLPDEYMLSGRLEDIPLGRIQQSVWQNRMLEVVLWFVAPLLLFTMIDNVYGFRKLQKRNKQK